VSYTSITIIAKSHIEKDFGTTSPKSCAWIVSTNPYRPSFTSFLREKEIENE
jgi:hypothetical protein